MDTDDIRSVYFSGSSSDTNPYNCQTKDFLSRNVINVLVVDDDATSLSTAAAILTRWKYRATKARHAIDALCILRMKGGIKFDLVVTDVRMPDMDGFELHNQIRKEFVNLPVVFMSGDQSQATVAKGLTNGGLCFMKKPLGAEDVRDLWQYVHDLKKNLENDKKEGKKIAVPENNSNTNGGTGQSKKDSKRPATKTGDSNVEQKKEKRRAKLVWTTHLHYRFLDALRILEKGRCVPKNILEFMNVPGLTRDHIASHLQKYRLFLNRVKDGSSTDSRMADQNLQYSSLLSEKTTSLMHNNIGQQQMLSPSLHQGTGGHNNFQVLNSLNLTNVSNPNHAAPMTNPIPPSGYGQSRLLTHPAISRGPMTGTSSSMTMYQPPKKSPPNLLNSGPSTYGTPTLGIGGCGGGSTVPAYGTIGASSSSCPVQNLSHFNTNYNGYQTPAEHNIVGNDRQIDQACGSMNKPNSSIFDLVFSRKPGVPSDLSSIMLNGINEQSSTDNYQQSIEQENSNLGTLMGSNHVGDPLLINGQYSNDMQQNEQENPNLGSTSMGLNHAGDPLPMINGHYFADIQHNEPAEPNFGAGTSMGASHVEDPLMMNGQHSNHAMQIEGEDVTYSIFGHDGIDFDEDVTYSIFGNDEVDLEEFFSWFDQNPNPHSQMEIGETSMLNHSNPSASHPTPAGGVIDDEDFLASLLVPEEPYGMDVDYFGE